MRGVMATVLDYSLQVSSNSSHAFTLTLERILLGNLWTPYSLRQWVSVIIVLLLRMALALNNSRCLIGHKTKKKKRTHTVLYIAYYDFQIKPKIDLKRVDTHTQKRYVLGMYNSQQYLMLRCQV